MQASNAVWLTSACLAPVAYYELLANRHIRLESHEHYVKQTYRNRCHIVSANGIMPLVIPVEKPQGKCLTRDVRIAEQGNWQTLHWRAMEAAYNSSPFFEYYQDDLRPFYHKKWEFLFDFNTEIQAKVLELLDLEADIQPTESYLSNVPEGDTDFRGTFRPKGEDEYFVKPYYQVFGGKFGFVPNASIVDLLFNMGTESILFLKNRER